MNDIRNAEGYVDETACKAIHNTKDGKQMRTPVAGEIWEDVRGKEYLFISVNGEVGNVLALIDQQRDGCVAITSKSLKYADPRFLQYRFTGLINKFVKSVPDNVLISVRNAVMNALNETDGQTFNSETRAPEALKYGLPWECMYKQLLDRLIEKGVRIIEGEGTASKNQGD